MRKGSLAVRMLVLLSLLALTAACGGGGGGGGGGTPAGGGTPPPVPLATGAFVKQFGPSASSSNFFPFSGGTGTAYDTKTQYLYTPSEIGGSGPITKIRLRSNGTSPAVTCPNMTLKMGHTTVSALTITFANNVNTGKGAEQTVLTDTTVIIPAVVVGSWIEVALTTPFDYNGVDNLVVDFERSTRCTASVLTTTYSGTGRRAYSSAVDTIAGTAEYDAIYALGVDNFQPWMQFVFAGGDNNITFGGASGNAVPFRSTTDHVQMLYLANEINGSGPITGIGFEIGTLTTGGNYTYVVNLAHTTVSALSSTFSDNYDSGAPTTVVSTATFTIPANIPVGSYIWIPLSGSFSYNGTSNLIVDIDVSYGSGNTFLNTANTTAGRRVVGRTGATVALSRDNVTYHVMFRFNGGKILVLPNSGAISNQVLGSGTAGQLQSLYKNTMLGTSGTINNVYVRLASGSTPTAASLTNYKLYMGLTTKSTLTTADTYASNMDENATVFSGTLTVPAGLKAGDWIKIPLSQAFSYDSNKNLCILFTTDAGPLGNSVSAAFSASMLFSQTVGRNDNSVTSSGVPTWNYNGVLNLALDISK